MKKKLIKNVSLLVAMAMICFAMVVMSSAEIWGDFEYKILDDGTVEITKCIGIEYKRELILPDEIDNRIVTSIGNNAFRYGGNIRNLKLPENLKTVGDKTFENLYSLNNIELSEENKYFSIDEHGVLYNKERTKLIYYPVMNENETYIIADSVTVIGCGAFYNNQYIREIIIPDMVTVIGDNAFFGCINLDSIVLTDEITTIGDRAFSGCRSLKGISLPANITNIGYSVFSSCESITSISIPESIMSIGDYAFSGCVSLEKIILPDNLKDLNHNMFCGTAYYNNTDNWVDGALYICNHLVAVKESCVDLVIPDNIVSVAEDAFGGSEIRTITIGKSVKNIERDINMAFFSNCLFIERFYVHSENEYFSADENGVLFNKNKTILLKYPCSNIAESYIVPDTVITIDNWAFEFSMNLTNIVLNEELRTIGKCAFCYCFGLREITIEKNITYIGLGAFSSIFFINEINVKCMNANIEGYLCTPSEEGVYFEGISYEDFCPLMKHWIKTGDEAAYSEIMKYLVGGTDYPNLGTIYCHPGSTTEAYAIENGAKYVLTHFFEDEWTYDYENGIKYRKCIHCDELEKHILTATVTEPTCATQGYTTYICECGETYTRDYTSATNHIDNNSDYECDYGCGYEFEKPADSTPDEPANQTFIQKIINWFKNLFDKLFGWLKR